MTRLASALSAVLFLAACSAGGGGPRLIPLPLPLPVNHGLTTGEITVLPGASDEHGNLVVSCPAGGQACILNVADDGSASYDKTGGMPALMTARQNLELPAGHGLADDQITVLPGASDEHGNLVVSCPAGGQACVINVADDGSASYDKTGGMPALMTARQNLELPAGHGLADDQITVLPGASDEHGNLVVSCPADGQACVINVADDGSASYDKTGGIPTLMTARQNLELPAGHGLADDQITVLPGASDEHGNLVVSCPADGQACVINLADDGSASYDKTGGIPALMTARQNLELPAGHGLADDQITVLPGASNEHGNLVVSCPADGQACVINLADDGSASYDKTGGIPTLMTARQNLELPAGHGLADDQITVLPGASDEHGNIVVSCPVGGQACILNVADDGTASYQRTGGVPSVRPIPLMAGPGQNFGDGSPVFANNETGSLKEALDAGNVLPTLGATLVRNRGSVQNTELSEDFLVKSIWRNAGGEYVINYVIDGTEEEITLDTGNCSSFDCEFFVNGRRVFFWSWTRDDDDPSIEDGLGEFRYLASHGLSYNHTAEIQARPWFVFGVRTEDLPMGTATHHGRFQSWSFRTANPDWNMRLFISGAMRLVANFDMRSLDGRIIGIRGRRADQNQTRTWETSSFAITEGRIVNGQFTATLTGLDSDPSTSFDESVRGFMGHILGEFYGPNAEEVGGVVTATRDVAGTADDRVLHGFIGGTKIDRLTDVNDPKALWIAVDSDDQGSTTVATAKTAAIEATTDGYRITYVVDGQTQTLDLSESDFGVNPYNVTRYEKRTNGTRYIFWDETRAFDGRRRLFLGRFRPEHFDVNNLSIIHYDASDNPTSRTIAYVIHGNRTMDMPTNGTATYAGGIYFREWPTDQFAGHNSPSVTFYRGDVNLSADFAASSVAGTAAIRESRPGANRDNRNWVNASGGLSFNATVDGNGLSATDLSGSGDLAGYSGGRVNGAFYGPGAAEVVGVVDATHGSENRAFGGYFGGQKQ